MSDDFLARWSRRKRAADTEETPPIVADELPREVVPDESDAEILSRLGLRHPDEMEPGDDFAAFVRAAVPRHLKSIAYRRLWRSNPTLACLDGLNDYDGDFTGTGVPEGGLKTSYEVGRGFAKRAMKIVEDLATDAPAAEPPDGETDGDADGEIAHAPTEAATPVNRAGKAAASESVQENDTPRPTGRRMVFRTKA